MIDLKELERRLDEALSKETEASLTEWLLAQRKGDMFCYDHICIENTTKHEAYNVYDINQLNIETSFNNAETKSIDIDISAIDSFDFGFRREDMEYSSLVIINLSAA